MTLLVILLLAAAGAFGYLAWKHGVSAAVAAVVAAGASIWAALSGLADMF